MGSTGFIENRAFKLAGSGRAYILRGVKETALTDAEKQELRRKNINNATQIGDKAIAPIGGGATTAGTSVVCQFRADKCLDEIRIHQSYLETQPAEVRSALQDKGINISGNMEFKLVLLDSLWKF